MKTANGIVYSRLREIVASLYACGVSEAEREARLIIAHILKLSPAEIFLHDTSWGNEQDIITETILKRRKTGMPLQYILGETEFMSLPFKVNEQVLIPRADTECIVEEAVALFREASRAEIADICTGSGAIAVSLAYYLPRARIWAADISAGAVDIARENAAINGVSSRIVFKEGDLFTPLENRRFDLIVVNPPYIAASELSALPEEVKREPLIALNGGDGLDFHRRIASEAVANLKENGFLLTETGCDQKDTVSALLKKYFTIIKYLNDLGGRHRGILAKRK
jgi:release factor glutamine methyltransferase